MNTLESTELAKRFIETLLNLPIITCRNSCEELIPNILLKIPDFMNQCFSSVITDSILQSMEPGILYHMTDPYDLNFLMFIYDKQQIFLQGPILPIRILRKTVYKSFRKIT